MIRLAEYGDLEKIAEIYQTAREYMRDTGNPTQWGDKNPPIAILQDDIVCKQLYVCVENGIIHGVFAFIIGEEPTYLHIEDGNWHDDSPYGTIHRIASDGTVKGVFAETLAFCRSKINHIRIDTHRNNGTMRHLVEKHGFERCGIIYVADGSPRIAYEYIK